MKAGVWLLAAASLGVSLVYTGSEEHVASPGYALDRDWAASSPLGVGPAAQAAAPQAAATPTCAVCGRVEAVASMPHVQASGKKTVFEVRVRMEDGRAQTVRVEKRLAVGTPVMLEHGVLRVASA
ncbi:hypothetical protein RD110_00895 [Rhodoferax koreense]|uniref:Uncharacterized protein n=2 Tax=Rhodoferax koreensis TaxID=1842727 RepID=A0A1P8JQB1_9BURK|nr:hypothetical protein RD110_00895 [Rhodoferax koreense]